MKIKLLFAISQYYKGGAETSLNNLFVKLDKDKYEISLVILNQAPVKNAVSLINKIPHEVKLCNAYGKRGKDSYINRIKAKFLYTNQQRTRHFIKSLEFVRNKTFDWAFAVGEWSTPEFVAKEVNAVNKVAWLHSDISEAQYFNSYEYFRFYEDFDKFIFVSQKSMESSILKYPFLKEKSMVIYNISNADEIRELSGEKTEPLNYNTKIPTLITCANFRSEKCHVRQVEVMKSLFDKGYRFNWLNLGALTDQNLVDDFKNKVKTYKLEKYCFALGAKSNPYNYMSMADAVTVLSDHESWSMVITEAKILGIPVIATKTSGALEQIVHGESGLLADFENEDIVDKIEVFLRDEKLRDKIKNNIKNFDNTDEILTSFDNLIASYEKSAEKKFDNNILYVIDDINYLGGAHIATKSQINMLLGKGWDITVFSLNIPNPVVREELLGVKFLSWRDLKEDALYNKRLLNCLLDKNLSKEEKKYRLLMSTISRRKKGDSFSECVFKRLRLLFSKYDTICVISEGSVFKEEVAESTAKTKVQWIHTDYCYWITTNKWAEKLTSNDGKLWAKYDSIVVLANNIRDKMTKKFPHLKEKFVVIKNIMSIDEINKKARQFDDPNRLKFLTVGRIDVPKALLRLIPILGRLKREGYKFFWRIVGDGSQFYSVTSLISKYDLKEEVILEGAKSNPFIYFKEADVFALPSVYEGLPNTIYESLILGVPVIATNVGGILEQVVNGETGWLVDNNEKAIYNGLKYILDNPSSVKIITDKLKNYNYDNEKILNSVLRVFLK